MKIGLIVEDRYADAIKNICRRIGISAEIRQQRGRINVTKASSYTKTLLDSCKKVIILPDAHCNPEKERGGVNEVYKRLPEELKCRVKICVIVHELESWLLSDENSLPNYLKYSVKEVKNPEDICDAKGYLEQIFRKAGRTYLTSMAEGIAAQMDLSKVSEKCQSFRNFVKGVKDC